MEEAAAVIRVTVVMGGDSRGSSGDVGGSGKDGEVSYNNDIKWQDVARYWRERPTGNDRTCTKTNDVLDAEYTGDQISVKKITIIVLTDW